MSRIFYEISTGEKTFEELPDQEVQRCFSNTVFPDYAVSLPNTSLTYYGGWGTSIRNSTNEMFYDIAVN